MDHDAQRITLTLLLFEATDGRRTLTDALAKAFVSFFNSESAWHASINQDGGHEAALSEGDLVTGGHPYYVVCSGGQASPRSSTDLFFVLFSFLPFSLFCPFLFPVLSLSFWH
jgi:hypothetical protein